MDYATLLRRNSNENEEEKAEQMRAKLKKLGLSDMRCLNALAASGYVHPSKAGEWLVNHSDDPDVEKLMGRECFVFLCPVGNIVPALLDYWQACRRVIDWNAALEYPPHITLLPPFEVSNSHIVTVHKVLSEVTKKFLTRSLPEKLPLNPYTNSDPNFLGYVVPAPVKTVLEEFTNEAIDVLQKNGINFPVETLSKRKGIYHLSLAYGYHNSCVNDLNNLVAKLLPLSVIKEDCEWEIRLYSRDGRLSSFKDVETFEMQASYVSERVEELNFHCGDHIAQLGSSEALRHGWAAGMNLNVGTMGEFVPTMGERVPQYYSWTLHRVWNFTHPLPPATPPLNFESAIFSFSSNGAATAAVSSVDNHPIKSIKETRVMRSSSLKSETKPRRILIMRHGERMDMCFGRQWINRCFDNKGIYKRLNLNMPPTLPPGRPSIEFALDCPLTQIGSLVSQETGRGLALTGTSINYCYVSPALRCIQTATELLKGCCQSQLPLRIEPHLFEWLGWYSNQMPQFLSAQELRKAGYNVDMQYKAYSSEKDFDQKETIEKYYDRTAKVVKKLVEYHKTKGVVLLIVGHAGSLDTCSRALVSKSFSLSSSFSRSLPSSSHGKTNRSGGDASGSLNSSLSQEFTYRASHVPYCGMAMVEEVRNNKWQFVQPPVPAFTHGPNADFDWRSLHS